MAIGGCEVSYCFFKKNRPRRLLFYKNLKKDKNLKNMEDALENVLPDLENAEEVRKAVIASEILNRKW